MLSFFVDLYSNILNIVLFDWIQSNYITNSFNSIHNFSLYQFILDFFILIEFINLDDLNSLADWTFYLKKMNSFLNISASKLIPGLTDDWLNELDYLGPTHLMFFHENCKFLFYSIFDYYNFFLHYFFYINSFFSKTLFFNITSLSFWIVPSFILFFGGILTFLSVKTSGWNDNVWVLANKIILLAFLYNSLLIYFCFKLNSDGIFLKVGFASLLSVPTNYNIFKLIAGNLILFILFITNDFIKYYYDLNLNEIKGELASLTLFLGFGSNMVFFQNDLFSIFLYLEIISFCIYGFLFLQKWTNEQLQDLIRYILFSLWITTFFVLSLSFYLSWSEYSTSLVHSEALRNLSNNFSLTNLKTLVITEPQLTLSLFLLIFYFLFKLGIGPFFTWTIPVYNSCSTGVLLVVSLVPKIIYFFILFSLVFMNFLPFFIIWSDLSLFLGILTVLIGSIGIIRTFKLKEIYAWSSIIHTGNILCIFSTISKETIIFLYFYIFSYIIVSIGFIYIFISLKNKQTGRFVKTSEELYSSTNLMSFFSYPSIVVMSSASGFTPLISFFMKLSMFICLSQIYGPILALVVGLMNIGGSIIYLKILRSLVGFNFNNFFFKKLVFFCSLTTYEITRKLSYILNLLCIIIVFGLPLFIDFTNIFHLKGTLSYKF